MVPDRRLFLNRPRAAGISEHALPRVPPTHTKPGLNLAFLHQFLSLLSIMIPRWGGKEAGLLISQGAFLMLRTYLSLVVARLDGEIVRDLVAGNGRGFSLGIIKWCGIGGLASYTNAAIKFLQNKVSIAFRTRLTRYMYVRAFFRTLAKIGHRTRKLLGVGLRLAIFPSSFRYCSTPGVRC